MSESSGNTSHENGVRRPDSERSRQRKMMGGFAVLGAGIVVAGGITLVNLFGGGDSARPVDSAAIIASESSRASESAAASRSQAEASASSAASLSSAQASMSNAAASLSSAEASASSASSAASESSASSSSSSATTASPVPTPTAPAPAPRTEFAVNCDSDPGYCAPDGAPVGNAPFLGAYALNANSNGDPSTGIRYPQNGQTLSLLCHGTGNFSGWVMVHTDQSWAAPNNSGQGDPYSGYIEAAVVPGAAGAGRACTSADDYSRNF
jgi:hypothetical protein